MPPLAVDYMLSLMVDHMPRLNEERRLCLVVECMPGLTAVCRTNLREGVEILCLAEDKLKQKVVAVLVVALLLVPYKLFQFHMVPVIRGMSLSYQYANSLVI